MKLERFDSICIWSEDPKKLVNWYVEMIGVEITKEVDIPEDRGYEIKVGDDDLLFWIGYHDKVIGKNKEPYRIMVCFIVDDVYKAYEELSAKGVEFIAKPRVSPTGDYDICTALDLDGNIIQLITYHKK
jgi:catechol 2,3-dioxygenase-like lactoylglutathione lyase family enzyme